MRRRMWLVVVGAVTAAGVDVVGNLAPLPSSWQPYLWLAWPTLGLLLAAAVIADIAGRRRDRREPVPPPAEPVRDGVVQNVVVSNGVAHIVANGNIYLHGSTGATPVAETGGEADDRR